VPQGIIARERSLRPKQSPTWPEDGFASFAMTMPQGVIARERPLRPKQSPTWPEDGFASFAMTGASREMATQTHYNRLSKTLLQDNLFFLLL